MAQFVKVTSVDDLHHLYPNLQIDHIDGIQCMLQDDQITQYTDGQGQQVIATIEQTGMQLSQNIGSPTQIAPQHQQIVVHQPTQYIIQQMDTNDHQTVHYIQQSHQPAKKKDEDQLSEQNIGSVTTSTPPENSPFKQYIVKSQNDNHFVSQIQPIIHQPIQIHQEIQAVDVGGNILVLQSPEKQEYIRCPSVQQEIISNQKEKPRNQIFQRQQQKSPEKIQNRENASQHLIQQQVNQNSQTSQSGKQEKIIHHPHQQIIQQLQYYNKITVVDDPFQPNLGIGSAIKPNENLSRQYQAIHQSQLVQQQQFRPQKKVEQQTVNSVQQSQHLLIPQLSSTPQTTRILQQRQRGQQETETSAAPVLIFQKLDGPLFIRQPQIKNCFQASTGSSDKTVKTAIQFKAKPYDSNLGHNEKNQEFPRSAPQISQSTEIEQKVDLLGAQSQTNKFSIDKQQSGELKGAFVEQPSNNAAVDQGNKAKVSSTVVIRSPPTKIKTTDQQTESISVGDNHRMEKFTTNVQIQPQTTPSLASQPTQIHLQYHSTPQNQVLVANRQVDNGTKKAYKAQSLKSGQQVGPGGQGIQIQNSPPRMPNTEKGDLSKNLKFTCGVINGPRVGCNPNEINQKLSRQVASQAAQPNSSNKEANLTLNENADEATMLVILLNGEKKRIKIPCSQQNILLGQILQQAGISSSPASISIEQNLEDCSSEQLIIKTNTPGSQTSTSKGPVVAQFIPNFIATPRGFFATVQQQRPRATVPRLTQTSNLGIVRQRLQISSPRLSNSVSAQQVITSTGLSSEVSLHSQLHQNITATSPPVKEELPRYMPGYMAICPFCGIQSVDFNKCVRCKRKLPENVKYQSICNSKKKKTEKAENEKNAGENKLETEGKQFDSPSTEVKQKIFLQLHDKKKPKGSVKKKKISDEPTEILILSSDDEEEDHKLKKTDLNKDSSLVFNKEPVYLNSQTSDFEMNNILKESSLSEDLMKNVQPGYFATLQCRNIRIGSYKVQPKERVFVSSKGIKLIINSLKNENSIIMIPLNNILKVLIHFGRQIPVIFVYPLPQVGAQIRSILGMDDKMGPYYDPASTDEESHKRITLLLEKITEDNKITLHKIFEPDKLDELSEKEANEILLRASPLENRSIGANRSQENIRKIMVYPPPPEKGGITLNNQDYACLGEDQFLNDVIIDFYLKYLLLKVLSPEDRNRTHVFSTFFYKRLTTKPKTIRKNDPENDPKLSPAEKRHMRVKGWTKQVNLFEKDFIIVPINEHSHWFLAIICFPGLTGPVRFSDNKPIEIEEIAPKKNTQTLQIGDTTITHIMKPDGSTISLEMNSGSDRDEAEGDQDDLHPSSDDEECETTEAESNSATPPVQIPLLAPLSQSQSSIKDPKLKVLKRKAFKEPIKQPCILIFDSLAGASRVRVVATLRDYLKIEYKKKMGQDRDFTKDTIKGAVPKVPQQNNFTDCGLYVLQYVESFFQDPLHDFKLPLKYLQEWFPEEVVSNKRQKLARLIKTLMEEQGIKVEEIGLPVLTFTNESNPTDCTREEDDDDEEEMNDESEEMLKNRVNVSDLDNDEEDDMDLGEDEEMEEDEDDELEIGDLQGRLIGRIKNSKNEIGHSVEHINTHALLKNCSLVDYEASESEEEDCLSSPQTSLTLSRGQASSPTETVEEAEYCIAARATTDNDKSVPLTELQDFESQISCTTIEKTYECKNTDCEVASSDEKYKIIANEEETSLEGTNVCSSMTVNLNCNDVVHPVESRHFPSSVTLTKGIRSTIVADINKKLVKEKTISPSRKDEEESEDESSFLFKNNLDNKLYIPKNCDKSEESKKVRTTFVSLKNNVAAGKRTYQALKSIRIPKKAERNLEVPGKRQKVDET